MKTIKQLKKLINYCQTDDVFKEYLKNLESANVIGIEEGDIVGKSVSDDFYERVAHVFGIQLDNNFDIIKADFED